MSIIKSPRYVLLFFGLFFSVLSVIYDASGADDLLAEQIVILVNKYY
ncbi:hypothetical protein BC624_10811 [Flavobacterium granuli]|uniref:Uncharacterized protein n=1 Tax=Flavobacterium granuli TaxID=280093 RepID=A0A1M5R229_9FLAO|nr:hypothetical protein BC624_10811 [Flavobacterium granuli]SHH20136.1 hypothetical protein SAMN05443373_10911 [Flavobacterium granuli]